MMERMEWYRPTRAPDSAGGIAESFERQPAPLWGAANLYQGALMLSFKAAELLPGDVVETADGAAYRVEQVTGPTRAPVRSAVVVRYTRPLHPRARTP